MANRNKILNLIAAMAGATLCWPAAAQPERPDYRPSPEVTERCPTPKRSDKLAGSALYRMHVRDTIDMVQVNAAFPDMLKRTLGAPEKGEDDYFALFRFAKTGEAIRMRFNADFDPALWNTSIHRLPEPEFDEPWYWYDSGTTHRIVRQRTVVLSEPVTARGGDLTTAEMELFELQRARFPLSAQGMNALFPDRKVTSIPSLDSSVPRYRVTSFDTTPKWQRVCLLDFDCHPTAGPLPVRFVLYLQSHRLSNVCYRHDVSSWVDGGTVGFLPERRVAAKFYVLPGDELPADVFRSGNEEEILKLLDDRESKARYKETREWELMEHNEHPWLRTDLMKNYAGPVTERTMTD